MFFKLPVIAPTRERVFVAVQFSVVAPAVFNKLALPFYGKLGPYLFTADSNFQQYDVVAPKLVPWSRPQFFNFV